MDKKNKISLIIILIITLICIGICIYSIIYNKNIKSNDAIKFRNEYMEYNDKVNENTDKAYVNVIISDTNTVNYVNENEAIELLEKGTGIIYFGFATCPWCRSLVSTLTSVAEEKKEPIYYLDILSIRSSYELEDGKLSKIKDGTDKYYQILQLLNNELDEFYLTDESGNVYDTGEKRLYAPTIVAISNGKITGIHVGTVDSQESGNDSLNSEQIEELSKIIGNLIDNNKKLDVCTQEKC